MDTWETPHTPVVGPIYIPYPKYPKGLESAAADFLQKKLSFCLARLSEFLVAAILDYIHYNLVEGSSGKVGEVQLVNLDRAPARLFDAYGPYLIDPLWRPTARYTIVLGPAWVCRRITSQRLLDQSQASVCRAKHHIPPHFGPFWAYLRTLPQGVELLV